MNSTDNSALLLEVVTAYYQASATCAACGMTKEEEECKKRIAEIRLQIAHSLDAKASLLWHAKITPADS